jgi:hypothetical protein
MNFMLSLNPEIPLADAPAGLLNPQEIFLNRQYTWVWRLLLI